tara:strand:- start:45 stop:704 length:660 start_codon:yes stop_codon:yes gene_type:complete
MINKNKYIIIILYMSFNEFELSPHESYRKLEKEEILPKYEASRDSTDSISSKKVCNVIKKLFIFMSGVYMLIFYGLSAAALTDTPYKKQHKICVLSNLWLYLLFSLFSNGLFLKVRRDFNQEKLFLIIKPNLEVLGVKILFFIWGSVEFYSISCVDDLRKTDLFSWALMQYLLDIQSIASIFCYTLWIWYKVKTDNERLRLEAIHALTRSGEYIESVRI